jgi:hypothetical protein
MTQPPMKTDALDRLQEDTLGYFLKEANRANGMVPDNTRTGAHASIAAIGFALTAYVIGVERGFMTRRDAIERTLTTLRFFWNSPQGEDPDATGHRGFYYHFLHMDTGRRAWESELSTIDSAFLLAGMLAAGTYFDGANPEEREVRTLADQLYRRADWQWAQNAGRTVTHGWKPETGFIQYRWEGYSEALILYRAAVGRGRRPSAHSCHSRCAGRTRDEGYLGTEEFVERGQRGGEPTDQNIDCRLGGRAQHSILLDRVAERSRLLCSGRRSPRRIAKDNAVSQVIEGGPPEDGAARRQPDADRAGPGHLARRLRPFTGGARSGWA